MGREALHLLPWICQGKRDAKLAHSTRCVRNDSVRVCCHAPVRHGRTGGLESATGQGFLYFK